MQYKNEAILVNYTGGDKAHALSAWASTFTEFECEMPEEVKDRIEALYQASIKKKKNSMQDLLNMLAQSNPKHSVPFEHSHLMFVMTADIASHIHNLKHRIAVSINTESARYKELKDKFYIPDEWNEIDLTPIEKEQIQELGLGQGSHLNTWADVLIEATIRQQKLYHMSLKGLHKAGLKRKRAKETSRYFLTYNKQLTWFATFNFLSFMHFLKLRNKPEAQKEIRDIAQSMLEQVQAVGEFDLSLKAFGHH